MRKVQVSYHVNDVLHREVYRSAVVTDETTGQYLEYSGYDRQPRNTSDREIASAALEWAVTMTGEQYGLLEYSGTPQAEVTSVRNYPKIEVKPVDRNLNEAFTAQKPTLRVALGLVE